mmetsp:Transcript_59245/g.95796  ORF Transcript_59245/g.95796 Transcript_59245/m.95796 type:complete len:82 (+) Transcript_59245:607-852(+)
MWLRGRPQSGPLPPRKRSANAGLRIAVPRVPVMLSIDTTATEATLHSPRLLIIAATESVRQTQDASDHRTCESQTYCGFIA